MTTHTTGNTLPPEPEVPGASGQDRRGWLRARWPRLLISVILLAIVVSRVDRRELGAVLSRIDLGFLGLALGASFAMLGLNALRWQVMLLAQGTRVPLRLVVYYYFIGAFFNTFMPTSVGGDFVRVLSASRYTGRRSVALASVVVERLLGFFALVPVSLAGILLTYREFQNPRLLVVLEGVALFMFALVGVMLSNRVAMGIIRLLRPLLSRFRQIDIEEKLRSVYEALRLYGEKRAALAGGFLLSLLSRLVWILGGAWIASALSAEMITFPRLLVVVPLVELARVVPVSLSGVGVREGSFAGLMAQFGTGETETIVLAFLFYLLLTVNGMAGGVLYLIRTAVSAGHRGT